MGDASKKIGNRIVAVAVVLLAAVLIYHIASSYFLSPTATMHLGSGKFTATIADTQATRVKGLSGTHDLPSDRAMVFIFDTNSRWGIWMKDMNYAIDIIWLNESRRVVDFVTDVPPDSYPNRTFLPKEDARYVVELRSGMVRQKNIQVGQEAIFSGTKKAL